VLVYASTTERPNVPLFVPTVPAVVVTVTDSLPATVPEVPEAFRNLTSIYATGVAEAVATAVSASSADAPPAALIIADDDAEEGVVDSVVNAAIVKVTTAVLVVTTCGDVPVL